MRRMLRVVVIIIEVIFKVEEDEGGRNRLLQDLS